MPLYTSDSQGDSQLAAGKQNGRIHHQKTCFHEFSRNIPVGGIRSGCSMSAGESEYSVPNDSNDKGCNLMLETTVTTVTDSYLETALWSSLNYDDCDDCDNPTHFDDEYGYDDFTDDARKEATADCKRFLELLQDTDCPDGSEYDNLYDAADDLQGDSRIGHDFWLTRNGHGAGFWDGDYNDRESGIDYGDLICEVLYNEFGRYAELNLYATEDGKVDFD